MMVSCSPESTADPAQKNLTTFDLTGGKDVTRPISIVLEGMDNRDGSGGTTSGEMTHLGKFHGTVAPGSFEDAGNGSFIFTSLSDDTTVAANGDVLFSRSLLVFVFISQTQATYSGTITFVGGTGRFEGATGSMQIDNGVYNIIGIDDLGGPMGEYSHKGAGTITY
ncbi:hypothetical protein [Christiangramia aestuarii]|nr:hypothetical protein [Christiangramia aestuarii]